MQKVIVFLRCGRSSQETIAVRESAEALYHFLMKLFILQGILDSQILKKIQRDFMDEPGFTVHEWHVNEAAVIFRKLLIKAHKHHFLSERQCYVIIPECIACPAIDVTGKLVQKDDLGLQEGFARQKVLRSPQAAGGDESVVKS